MKRCRMAELAHSAPSSHELLASLDTFAYSPDDGEDEVHVGPTCDDTVQKQCATCKAYKPLEEFCKDVSKRDEKSIHCKVCRNHYAQTRRMIRERGGENAVQGSDEGPQQKDLYVFKNSRLPEYKIGRSGAIDVRSNGMDASQNFYMLRIAKFEGKGHLEGTVREMLRYYLMSREVGKGVEWYMCSLSTALAAIGTAIENENAQR